MDHFIGVTWGQTPGPEKTLRNGRLLSHVSEKWTSLYPPSGDRRRMDVLGDIQIVYNPLFLE